MVRTKPAAPTLTDISLDTDTAVPTGQRLVPSIKEALNELIAERKHVEEYTKEQHARLSRLRDMIRAERTAAEQEHVERRAELERLGGSAPDEVARLRHNLDVMTTERDAALQQLLLLKRKEQTAEPLTECVELEQLHRERDEARARMQQLTDELAAERAEVAALRADLAAMEKDLSDERRRLQEERRQLDEELRELFRREQAQRKEPAPTTAAPTTRPNSNAELCLFDAELREMKEILKEQIENGRAELHKERLRLAQLREQARMNDTK